jgi:hypothetical protein
MSFDRFLLAVESHDLSQAEKSNMYFNFWMIKFTIIPKKYYLALGNLTLSLKNLQDCKVNISQFFWWEVNLRGLRAFILQKVQASVVEKKITSATHHSDLGKKTFLSAWDRSHDSTAKRNLSKDM